MSAVKRYSWSTRKQQSSFSDDDRSGGLEGGLEGLARSSLDGVNLGEAEADLGEGAGVISQGLAWRNDAGLDDLD